MFYACHKSCLWQGFYRVSAFAEMPSRNSENPTASQSQLCSLSPKTLKRASGTTGFIRVSQSLSAVVGNVDHPKGNHIFTTTRIALKNLWKPNAFRCHFWSFPPKRYQNVFINDRAYKGLAKGFCDVRESSFSQGKVRFLTTRNATKKTCLT